MAGGGTGQVPAEAKRTLEREARTREVGKLREQAVQPAQNAMRHLREASQTSKASERLQTELTATQRPCRCQAGTHPRPHRADQHARQKLATERQEILAKIRALGYRANAGFDPTFLPPGRLAINYVHEGVLTLDEVVAKVPRARSRCDRPGCVRGPERPRPQAAGQSPQRCPEEVQELRTQARLLAKIGRASAGMLDTPKGQTASIAADPGIALATDAAGCRRTRRPQTRPAWSGRYNLITEIQNHLDNGTRPGSGSQEGQHDAGRAQQARQKIRDLKEPHAGNGPDRQPPPADPERRVCHPKPRPFERGARELDQVRIELRRPAQPSGRRSKNSDRGRPGADCREHEHLREP